MPERFEYSTQNLDKSSPIILEDEHDVLKGMQISTDISDFQKVEFSKDFWAYARVSRLRESAETNWANAIFNDERIGISLMYDYNYLNRAFQEDPDEDDGPYRAVLGIDQKNSGRLGGSFDLGFQAFWYDQNGQLTVIKDQTMYEMTNPSISFKRAGEVWKALFYSDQRDWGKRLLKAHEEGRGYTTDDHIATLLQVGKEVVVNELVYSLVENTDNRTVYTQKMIVGDKKRTIEIPSNIDLDKFRELIGSPKWAQLLDEFPIKAGLN